MRLPRSRISRPTTALVGLGPRLETGDQHEIDDLEGSIGVADCDDSAGRRLGQKLRVLD